MSDDQKAITAYDTSANLPAVTFAMVESSRINRIMGSLIAKAHAKNAKKIALLTWDSEEKTLEIASLLAGAFSNQLEHACALVVSEGIRIRKTTSTLHDTISLPDVEVPGLSEQVENTLLDMNRSYPVQIFAAPPMNQWSHHDSFKVKLALRSHAFLFAVPATGLPRRALTQIKQIIDHHKITLLGIIPYNTSGVQNG